MYVDIDEEGKVLMTKKTVRKALECVCAGCEKAFSNQQGLCSKLTKCTYWNTEKISHLLLLLLLPATAALCIRR